MMCSSCKAVIGNGEITPGYFFGCVACLVCGCLGAYGLFCCLFSVDKIREEITGGGSSYSATDYIMFIIPFPLLIGILTFLWHPVSKFNLIMLPLGILLPNLFCILLLKIGNKIKEKKLQKEKQKLTEEIFPKVLGYFESIGFDWPQDEKVFYMEIDDSTGKFKMREKGILLSSDGRCDVCYIDSKENSAVNVLITGNITKQTLFGNHYKDKGKDIYDCSRYFPICVKRVFILPADEFQKHNTVILGASFKKSLNFQLLLVAFDKCVPEKTFANDNYYLVADKTTHGTFICPSNDLIKGLPSTWTYKQGTTLNGTDYIPKSTIGNGSSNESSIVRKCPACGQILESFQSRCPSCGTEISKVTTAKSVKSFFDTLKSLKDDSRIDSIRYYPVPNSKEEIFEFTLMAVSLLEGSSSKEKAAWKTKLRQTSAKAMITFADDSDSMKKFNSIIEGVDIK